MKRGRRVLGENPPQPMEEVVPTSVQKRRRSNRRPEVRWFGLPAEVQRILFQHRGIDSLYDWQTRFLEEHSATEDFAVESQPSSQGGVKRNIVYTLPSGGKTLVAEVLILQTILLRKQDALMILPYVSIVEEKALSLEGIAELLGFRVEVYAGAKGRFPIQKAAESGRTVFIATIEKAATLVNYFLDDGEMGRLGLAVVDELHMLSTPGRGPILESCLTKIKYTHPTMRVIGMTATISNIDEVATFLNARVFEDNFRPVELEEFFVFGPPEMGLNIYTMDTLSNEDQAQGIRRVHNPKTSQIPEGADYYTLMAIGLVLEVIQHSALVFCGARKACETVAGQFAQALAWEPVSDLKRANRNALLQALADQVDEGAKPAYCDTIMAGVAYHHSGLMQDERALIEQAFLAGTISVLMCTTTLAAGVNLPARRVIILGPKMGFELLTKTEYKQITGRAGRAGHSSAGDSYLVLKNTAELNKIRKVLTAELPSCSSCLGEDFLRHLKCLLVSLVVSNVAMSIAEIERYMDSTLFRLQNPDQRGQVPDALKTLCEQGILKFNRAELRFSASQIAIAIHKSNLDCDIALALHRQLYDQQTLGIVLSNELQMLFFAIPDEDVLTVDPDLSKFYERFRRLNPAVGEVRAAENLGVQEGYLINACKMVIPSAKVLFEMRKTGGLAEAVKFNSGDHGTHKRFFLAMLLQDIVNGGMSINAAGQVYVTGKTTPMPPGKIQGLLQASAIKASRLVRFTSEFPELQRLAPIFDSMVQKLYHGVSADLAPLMEIPGVKQARAKQLYLAGFRTLRSLASTDPVTLVKQLPMLQKELALKIVTKSQKVLAEQAEYLKAQAADQLVGWHDVGAQNAT